MAPLVSPTPTASIKTWFTWCVLTPLQIIGTKLFYFFSLSYWTPCSLCYALILRSALRIASQLESPWVLNNCLSHILTVFILYVCLIGVSMTHNFAKHATPIVHVSMANVYVLASLVMNSIIYSIKVKHIVEEFFTSFLVNSWNRVLRSGFLILFLKKIIWETWKIMLHVSTHVWIIKQEWKLNTMFHFLNL